MNKPMNEERLSRIRQQIENHWIVLQADEQRLLAEHDRLAAEVERLTPLARVGELMEGLPLWTATQSYLGYDDKVEYAILTMDCVSPFRGESWLAALEAFAAENPPKEAPKR